MRKRILAVPVVAIALGLMGGTAAQAHGSHGAPATAGQPANAAPAKFIPGSAKAVFMVAKLNGRNEVQEPGKPAVGDPDGRALALVKIKGNRVSFALEYEGIGAPTLGHIHEGKAGVNGNVKVGLFTTAMPDTVSAAAGSLIVQDPAVTTAIRSNPAGFYVNVHSDEFKGGAVRGQLKAVKNRLDLLDLVKGGKLRAFLDADQEVAPANGAAFGDPDGHAVGFVRPKGDRLGYSLAWVGIAAPTKGHLHQGKFGTNGDIKVDLLNVPVPANIFAISGSAQNVDAALIKQIQSQPKDFYLNIHTAEFPGGAVRGQLFR
jgi:hypothetical protein